MLGSRLCEKHNECVFLSFTNGTLIDDKFADEMLRAKKFYPAISVVRFVEATNFRRGKGTYSKAIGAMDILKRKKCRLVFLLVTLAKIQML